MVLLEDRVDQTANIVGTCQNALANTFMVMLPRNLPPSNFAQLLEEFRNVSKIQRLIELQFIVGAQFALAWIRLWISELETDYMSRGFPPKSGDKVRLQKHLEATLQPAERMINKLLQVD
jgi:hypothetical protein